jgi:hypothetical protein
MFGQPVESGRPPSSCKIQLQAGTRHPKPSTDAHRHIPRRALFSLPAGEPMSARSRDFLLHARLRVDPVHLPGLAIQQHFDGRLEVLGAEAGMQLAVLLPRGVGDVAVARKAAKKGVSARPLSGCYLRAPARGGLILGYGGAVVAAIVRPCRYSRPVSKWPLRSALNKGQE